MPLSLKQLMLTCFMSHISWISHILNSVNDRLHRWTDGFREIKAWLRRLCINSNHAHCDHRVELGSCLKSQSMMGVCTALPAPPLCRWGRCIKESFCRWKQTPAATHTEIFVTNCGFPAEKWRRHSHSGSLWPLLPQVRKTLLSPFLDVGFTAADSGGVEVQSKSDNIMSLFQYLLIWQFIFVKMSLLKLLSMWVTVQLNSDSL